MTIALSHFAERLSEPFVAGMEGCSPGVHLPKSDIKKVDCECCQSLLFDFK